MPLLSQPEESLWLSPSCPRTQESKDTIGPSCAQLGLSSLSLWTYSTQKVTQESPGPNTPNPHTSERWGRENPGVCKPTAAPRTPPPQTPLEGGEEEGGGYPCNRMHDWYFVASACHMRATVGTPLARQSCNADIHVDRSRCIAKHLNLRVEAPSKRSSTRVNSAAVEK